MDLRCSGPGLVLTIDTSAEELREAGFAKVAEVDNAANLRDLAIQYADVVTADELLERVVSEIP